MINKNPMSAFKDMKRPLSESDIFSFERFMQICFPDDCRDLEQQFNSGSFEYYQRNIKFNDQNFVMDVENCSDLFRFKISEHVNDTLVSVLNAELSRIDNCMLDDTHMSYGGSVAELFDSHEIYSVKQLIDFIETNEQ